jgi:hypothetical protein
MLRRAARCTRLPFWEMRIFGGIPPPPWSIGIIGLAGKWWFDLWGSTTYGQNLEGQGVRWDWWLGLTVGLDFFQEANAHSSLLRTRMSVPQAGPAAQNSYQKPNRQKSVESHPCRKKRGKDGASALPILLGLSALLVAGRSRFLGGFRRLRNDKI